MNLLVKKFGPLAVILQMAILAISCEDPGKIGLIVNAENAVISTHYQDIILPTSVVQFDPRKTLESGSVQAGEYVNPDFGKITSKSYSQLSLSTIVEPTDKAEFLSFEMSISFTSLVGEELTNDEKQSLGVYQLAEEIDPLGSYTRLDELTVNPDPLGVWSFAPQLNDTLQTDSTYIVSLDAIIGEDLFTKFKAGDAIFDNDTVFNEFFKGVAFVAAGNNRAIFQINLNSVKFNLNYEDENSEGTLVDESYEFSLGNARFFYLDSDKSGTSLSGINPDNTDFYPSDDYRYLQYGTLMGIKVDLTSFYLLSDTLENMIINKAELSVGQVKQYGGEMEPPPFLEAYFTDETNKWPFIDDIGRIETSLVGKNFIEIQDEVKYPQPGVYSVPMSVFYDEDNFKYSVSLSWFFQNLYKGNFHSATEPFIEEKAEIYLFGSSDAIVPQSTFSHILTTPMAVHKDSIRLRIHYTIPKQD